MNDDLAIERFCDEQMTKAWLELQKEVYARYLREMDAVRHAYQTNLNVRLALGDWPEWNK